MSRKSGYYFVKDEGKWIVAEWDNDDMEWLIPGYELGLKDSEFEEIDPNPIVREEPKERTYDEMGRPSKTDKLT